MRDVKMRELAEFLDRYDVRQLHVDRDTDIRGNEATLVSLQCNPEPSEPAAESRINFKLLDEAAGAHHFLRAIGPPPECRLDLTAHGRELPPPELEATVSELLESIRPRVARIHKEQSILNTRPVGKTFELASGTRFEVLSEDGAGRLAIRILRDEGASEAAMAANDLLDGLHTGIIRPA